MIISNFKGQDQHSQVEDVGDDDDDDDIQLAGVGEQDSSRYLMRSAL